MNSKDSISMNVRTFGNQAILDIDGNITEHTFSSIYQKLYDIKKNITNDIILNLEKVSLFDFNYFERAVADISHNDISLINYEELINDENEIFFKKFI